MPTEFFTDPSALPQHIQHIGKRIRQVRTEIAQLSQESFACQMCMTQSNLSLIERQRVYPSCFLLYRLHLTYRINLNWLMTGQGDIRIKPCILL